MALRHLSLPSHPQHYHPIFHPQTPCHGGPGHRIGLPRASVTPRAQLITDKPRAHVTLSRTVELVTMVPRVWQTCGPPCKHPPHMSPAIDLSPAPWSTPPPALPSTPPPSQNTTCLDLAAPSSHTDLTPLLHNIHHQDPLPAARSPKKTSAPSAATNYHPRAPTAMSQAAPSTSKIA